MAFVYRANRNFATDGKKDVTVGPGSYTGHKDYKFNSNCAPFLSSSQRQPEHRKDLENVGPGSYNIVIETNPKEKVLVAGTNLEASLVEGPKPSMVFQSKTQRFNPKVNSVNETPGPGAYNQEILSMNASKAAYNVSVGKSSKTVTDDLLKVNRYQSIPSIPSQKHSFGYTENPNHDLELNKNPNQVHSGMGGERVGPGQYEIKGAFENSKGRGVPFHKISGKQTQKFAHSVGPGAYEANKAYQPLYKLKPSPGFVSKTLRSMDTRKIVKKVRTMSSSGHERSPSRSQQVGGADDDDEDDESVDEYIDEATPGPGYYYNPATTTSIKIDSKPAHLQFFGSNAERFKLFENKQNVLGPGVYNPRSTFDEPAIKKNAKTPFMSKKERFHNFVTKSGPGPGAYDPRIKLEDRLRSSVKKGYNGNFGISSKRFVEGQIVQETPGPGTYDETDAGKTKKMNSVFVSKSNRIGFGGPQMEVPPVGAYEVDHHTIAKKVTKEEEDPDLAIPKVKFLSNQPRFPETKPKEKDGDNPYINPHHAHENIEEILMKRKQAQQNHPNLPKASRFPGNKPLTEVPGPGHYEKGEGWNKRTFNIIFADNEPAS